MPSPPLSLVQSLSPRIAVLTSEDVADSCAINGCRGLEELLRPWEGATERVSILSSTLTPTIHPTFPVRFVSWSSIYTNQALSSPNPDVVVDLISSQVSSRKPDEDQQYPLTRSLLLSSRPFAPHETFNHPVGVLYAVSTTEEDPVGAMKKLHNTMFGAAQSVPWMDSTQTMKFQVLVHDVSLGGEDLDGAQELLGTIKRVYGPHSTLLVINSRVERNIPPMSPDTTTHPSIPLPRALTPDEVNPSALSQIYASALSSLTLSPMSASAVMTDGHPPERPQTPTKPSRRKMYGSKLNAEDTQRLVAVVRELVVQSLIPWMEARVREWNESYLSNRRGITGRLFGAGRKFFGSRPNSPSPNSAQAGYNTVRGYYPVTAIEALSRRLADFAFMLRDYRHASSVYDSLRRDFAQDRAMRYAAAATEMYGLSLLLSHPYFLPSTPPNPPNNPFTNMQHTEIFSWLEQAVVQYNSRASASQIQLDALRITVLYYEAWKAIGEWRGVGNALERAASEAEEVPSAVMIEEAAAADVKGGRSDRGKRRRAFHLVQAARRYETAGLKTYSRRCLDRASAIYKTAPWTAAHDWIEYSLGRQAWNLGESDKASEHFLPLLRKEDTGMPGSQGGVLEDLKLAYEHLAAHPDRLDAAKEKLQLPTPIFAVQKTRIVTASSSEASSSGTTEDWNRLETQALNEWDRKGKKPMTLLDPQNSQIACIEEPFTVELLATNPLNAPLILKDLQLQFSDPGIKADSIPEIILEAYESRTISFPVTINFPSTITITSISFIFHGYLPVTQSLRKRGKRLFATKAHRITPTYGEDTSLTVSVEIARPRLRVELIGIPDSLLHGEEVKGVLRLRNEGKVGIRDIRVLWNEAGVVRRRDTGDSESASLDELANTLRNESELSLLPDGLAPGENCDSPFVISGTTIGLNNLLGLVTFINADNIDETVAIKLAHGYEGLPALEVRYALKPGKDIGSRVFLEVVNQSRNVIQVNDIKAFSPYWQESQETLSASKTATLFPQQVYRLALRIRPSDQVTKLDLSQSAVVGALSRLVQNQPLGGKQEHSSYAINCLASLPEASRISYINARSKSRLRYLRTTFSTLSLEQIQQIFPLFDPLDLDILVSWSVPNQANQRTGQTLQYGIRPAPEFSVVDDVRKEVDQAIAAGGKQTRTMYEETGRLRQVLMDNVLDGIYAIEEDPVLATINIPGGKRGVVSLDLEKGICTVNIEFEIQNRSPYLPVRWVLYLPEPPASNQSRDTASPTLPHFTGILSHRGRLQPQERHTIISSIWVDEPSLISLSGWELIVETGEPNVDKTDDQWIARRVWSRMGDGGVVEIVQR